MRNRIKEYEGDISFIMKRYVEQMQDIHAQTLRELEKVVSHAHHAGIDLGSEQVFENKKGEAA
tara:strand:+ start:289 stop:477 length:189 start_codon:yes stop_codon:yes gene_type:complete